MEFIMGLWDSISVRVTSRSTFIVWSYGGTKEEPHALQGWNRKYCWGNSVQSLLDTLRGVSDCTFIVPRFSIWAPFGRSTIGLQSSVPFLANTLETHANSSYIVEYNTEFDRSYPMYLIIGLFIFIVSPYLSHSNVFYMSSVSLLGGVGSFIVVLYLLTRVLPGERKGRMLAGMVSVSAIALQYFWDTVKFAMVEYVYFVMIIISVGGFFGFSLAYTHPLKSEITMNLIYITLRMVSLFCMLKGTNSALISTTIFLILLCLPKLCICIFNSPSQTQMHDPSGFIVNDYNADSYSEASHRKNLYMDKRAAEKLMEETTEAELDLLMESLAKGGDIVSKLSTTARTRCATAVYEYNSRDRDVTKDLPMNDKSGRCVCC